MSDINVNMELIETIIKALVEPQVLRINALQEKQTAMENRVTTLETHVNRTAGQIEEVLDLLQTVVNLRNFLVWISPIIMALLAYFALTN